MGEEKEMNRELLQRIRQVIKRVIFILESIPGMPSWVARWVIPILMLVAALLGIVLIFF
jgi:hypothetical protein